MALHTAKIIAGQAHTISEGDTLYLAACIKGIREGANKRRQYNSKILADQRAYALKSKYLNTIILDALANPEMIDNIYLSPKQRSKIRAEMDKVGSVVKSLNDYKENETFEELIRRKFTPYYGCSIYAIEASLGLRISSNPKSISRQVVHAILGVSSPKITEFVKADLQQKSIRLQANGTLQEAMSFAQIKYDDLLKEEYWEDSVWYKILSKRGLFVVFRKSDYKDDKSAVLERVFFWTMPYQDLLRARQFWQHTRDKVRLGIFDQFMPSRSGNICHVRPKAKNSHDLMPTQFGLQPKKAYWLNREYIFNLVSKNLST